MTTYVGKGAGLLVMTMPIAPDKAKPHQQAQTVTDTDWHNAHKVHT